MKSLNNIRVLIVDDLESYRYGMREMLQEIGVKNIAEARDGEEAWNKTLLESKGPEPFDLIISDINMPKMNGLELLKQVRSLKKTNMINYILVSTENENKTIFTALDLGISDYIIKPWEKESAKNKIQKVLAKIFANY